MITLTIYGNPIPKARPRVTRGKAYTPSRTSAYEQFVRDTASLMYSGDPLTGNIALTLRFYRATAHRCDLDNLIKAVGDAIQGVLLEDDSQVVTLLAQKTIDRDNPRVEIMVEAL